MSDIIWVSHYCAVNIALDHDTERTHLHVLLRQLGEGRHFRARQPLGGDDLPQLGVEFLLDRKLMSFFLNFWMVMLTGS
jgi:hypothetical protein